MCEVANGRRANEEGGCDGGESCALARGLASARVIGGDATAARLAATRPRRLVIAQLDSDVRGVRTLIVVPVYTRVFRRTKFGRPSFLLHRVRYTVLRAVVVLSGFRRIHP